MIAILAKMQVKPGSESKFEEAMLHLVEQVNAQEPGNRLYTLCKEPEGRYVVMELYDNEDAVTAHMQSEHVKASGPSFKGLMSGRPEFVRMDVLG